MTPRISNQPARTMLRLAELTLGPCHLAEGANTAVYLPTGSDGMRLRPFGFVPQGGIQ